MTEDDVHMRIVNLRTRRKSNLDLLQMTNALINLNRSFLKLSKEVDALNSMHAKLLKKLEEKN